MVTVVGSIDRHLLDRTDLRQEQFLDLVRGELDRAYRLAGLMLGSQDDAEDATQDALIRAWRSSESLRDVQSFQAWFDHILVNVCRDRVRRRRRIRFISIDGVTEVGPSPDPFRQLLDKDEVMRALAGLELDLRTVIVLRYWADLTVDDIAARLGCPAGTVKSRIHRGLRRMRRGMAMTERELPA